MQHGARCRRWACSPSTPRCTLAQARTAWLPRMIHVRAGCVVPAARRAFLRRRGTMWRASRAGHRCSPAHLPLATHVGRPAVRQQELRIATLACRLATRSAAHAVVGMTDRDAAPNGLRPHRAGRRAGQVVARPRAACGRSVRAASARRLAAAQSRTPPAPPPSRRPVAALAGHQARPQGTEAAPTRPSTERRWSTRTLRAAVPRPAMVRVVVVAVMVPLEVMVSVPRCSRVRTTRAPPAQPR